MHCKGCNELKLQLIQFHTIGTKSSSAGLVRQFLFWPNVFIPGVRTALCANPHVPGGGDGVDVKVSGRSSHEKNTRKVAPDLSDWFIPRIHRPQLGILVGQPSKPSGSLNLKLTNVPLRRCPNGARLDPRSTPV
jgi:hypothetical protein